MPQNWLEMSWKVLATRAGLGIIFGIAVIAWPKLAIVTFVVLWGVWALIDGIGALFAAFSSGVPGWARALAGVVALVSFAVAVIAIARPGVTAAAITWALGLWLLVRGAYELVGAFRVEGTPAKVLIAISGVLDVALGVLFVANPGRSALALAVLLGVMALVWGVVLLIAALALRSQVRAMAGAAEPEFDVRPSQG